MIKNLIGKPYRAGGRGPQYYDCWGLAMEAIKILTGKLIPDYKLDPDNTEENAFIAWTATNDGSWTEIPHAGANVPGLIVAFQLLGKGKITHVGVTTGNGMFLQATRRCGVTHEKLSRYQKIIEGYYAYNQQNG